MTPATHLEALDETEQIADTLETLSDTLIRLGLHQPADMAHALADELRKSHLGAWEAVFDHDDGRYLHLGHGADEAAAQALATTWAAQFGGRLDWHEPWPDGTRQADYLAPDDSDHRGTGIEVRPTRYADRQRRAREYQRSRDVRHFRDRADLRRKYDEALMRLARIGQAHCERAGAGECAECSRRWPCPTRAWVDTRRDLDACWNPADDEEANDPERTETT